MGWFFAGFIFVFIIEQIIRISKGYEPEREKRTKSRR